MALFCVSQLDAQTEAISSLSQYNLMYYNPGYAGEGNDIEARVLNRNQWMGFTTEGTPNTFTGNVDLPFKLFSRQHGVGLSIVSDQYGYWNNTSINLSYAYRKTLYQGELGIGLGVNLVNYSLSPTWVTGDVDASEDVMIPDGENQPIRADLNLGLFYSADNLYFSASMRNVLGASIQWKGEEDVSPTSTNQVFFLSTGYNYQLPNPMFSIQPNFQLLTDFTVNNINLNGILTYNNKLFGGIGYRPRDAATVIAGIRMENGVEVALSYDIITSRIIKSSYGSFEFMLGYTFNMNLDKDSRKYKSVRFL